MVALSQGIFSDSCSAMEEVQKKAVRERGQRDIPSHRTPWPVWVSYPGVGLIMVQDGFGITQQVVSNYIMHHLFLLGFTSLPSSSSYYYYYYYINIIFY